MICLRVDLFAGWQFHFVSQGMTGNKEQGYVQGHTSTHSKNQDFVFLNDYLQYRHNYNTAIFGTPIDQFCTGFFIPIPVISRDSIQSLSLKAFKLET